MKTQTKDAFPNPYTEELEEVISDLQDRMIDLIEEITELRTKVQALSFQLESK